MPSCNGSISLFGYQIGRLTPASGVANQASAFNTCTSRRSAGRVSGVFGTNRLDYSLDGGSAATVNLATSTASRTGGIAGIQALVGSTSAADTLIGVGFANYLEMTAHGTALFAAAGYPFIPGHEQAAVRFTPDGGLEIRVGVHSHGQGMETSLAQIAHEVLGLPIADIAVVLGDTAMTPYSTGTYASRSITMAESDAASASASAAASEARRDCACACSESRSNARIAASTSARR